MFRSLLPLLLLAVCMTAMAQNDTSHSNLAKVNVFVTDMKGKPTKGEQILFRSNGNQKTFSGYSDATGKFSLRLPIGDSYLITVKSITDTTKYGMINIPVLPADQF